MSESGRQSEISGEAISLGLRGERGEKSVMKTRKGEGGGVGWGGVGGMVGRRLDLTVLNK